MPQPGLPLDRFAAKVALAETGCLLWLAATDDDGYGRFSTPQGMRLAHRWIYEQVVGPIPSGLELDHLCRVRHCVLPAHLEPVTHAVNHQRGDGPSHLSLRNRPDPTKCGKGLHDWVEENIYYYPGGKRRCKPCKRSAQLSNRKEAPA